jgi:hypothetical protein
MNRIIFTIALLVSVLNVRAQEPQHWSGDEGIEVFQESTEVFNGTYSAGIIINSNDQSLCDFISTAEIPVTPGETFKISLSGFTSQNVRARAFFYWVGALRTNSTNYLGPNTGGWQQFEFEAIVPDNATGLNLGIRFYSIAGFTPGEIQRLDDITFESPAGNPLEVPNGDFESWASILPEPDNYPGSFSANDAGFNAILSWTDPQEGQLPENYLIKISTSATIALPEDGQYMSDDLNLSDGNGTVNVPYGQQSLTVAGLQSITGYYFKIFPYTNTGVNIDYKTDGIPPEAVVQTTEVSTLESENFDASWGNWTTVSVVGNQVWNRNNNFGIDNTSCARMTGASSGNILANEDWLISPPLDFTESKEEVLTFYSSVGFSASEQQLVLKISTDYTGQGNPNEATWQELNAVFPGNNTNFEWAYSGVVDLSGFESDSVFIAFVYTCDNTEASTWQIDNIAITASLVKEEPSNYPTDFTVTGGTKIILANWTDAVGEVIPDGYLLLISEQPEIEMPYDSIPVADDLDLSDGTGAVNLLPGNEYHAFTQLNNGTDYHLSLFPFTNAGILINYKTNGNPPIQAVSTDVGLNNFLITTFNDDWQGWEQHTVVGDNSWQRNDSLGLNNSACATIDTNGEVAEPTENWLVSPPVNLENTINQTLDFFAAKSQNFGQLQLLISDDYDGSETPQDFFWSDLSDNATFPGENQSGIWTWSEPIDISAYENKTIFVAFRFLATAEDTVRWMVDDIRISGQVTGIDEPAAKPDISLYPNPGSGLFNYQISTAGGTVMIYNAAGHCVYTNTRMPSTGKFDISHLPKGLYFLKISGENATRGISKKIIVR